MLDALFSLVMLFMIIGLFMAVHAVRESRDRLRVITRLVVRWSANARPDIFVGLQPRRVFVGRMEDGQTGSIEMNGEIFECMARGAIEAGENVTIIGVTGRSFIIEKAKA